MRLIFSFLLIFSSSVFSNDCTLSTHAKVLILSNDGDFSNLIKKSNCNDQSVSNFVNFARNARGHIKPTLLAKLFPEITFSPTSIEFVSLQEALENKSLLPNEASLMSATKLNRSSLIGLENDQRLELECRSCPTTGFHNIKISIRDNLGQYLSTEWVKAEVGVPVKALVSNSTQTPTFKAIDPSLLITKTIISSNPENLVRAKTPVQFFKFSKTINSGEVLQKDHISSLQLVRPGTQARVLIKDGTITINGFAEPLSYGIYDQTIKLKNSKTSKIFWGKVIDNNSVVVEL
ncbi:MAG: hypothetical protein COW79_03310 [Bdellovibrionales bacterium CG22_combo_CG10-13_8_21_14_all_38_13]|nr:MAG: hypothetical protein COW79_03310 [Bdellovibrionales bacterium CG22_combo_CG10-13_8_21_14_all_38_13]